MTESTNDQGLVFANGESGTAKIAAARLEKRVPDAYRLVRFRADDGKTHFKLQGYFTWRQGWSEEGWEVAGGNWKDIDTVDADDLSDDNPYGQLY
jgi:hypothetical protein